MLSYPRRTEMEKQIDREREREREGEGERAGGHWLRGRRDS